MDLHAWFQCLFPSPGDLLLALGGVVVLFGLIGGLTDSRGSAGADELPADDVDKASDKPWWKRDEEHTLEWNAHRLREQHRTGASHSAMD
jgi:hypothetical protein